VGHALFGGKTGWIEGAEPVAPKEPPPPAVTHPTPGTTPASQRGHRLRRIVLRRAGARSARSVRRGGTRFSAECVCRS
jgi:hypothetical protein